MTISAAVGTWPAGGWNSIRLRIEDDTGAVRTIDFNLFSNRALLDVGLSGLAFHASVQRRPIRSGIAYSDDFLVSGFWRRGMSAQARLDRSRHSPPTR